MRSVLFFLFSLALTAAIAQSTAQKRAARLGLGMNLSYLEGYWNGTRARHFSDFVKPDEVKARQQGLTDMARAGFKTVRIPVCFGAWASLDKPYRWDAPAALAAPDSLLNWALANKLTVIIDLHHVEFDGSIPGADSTDRVVWLWQQLAERYKHTDPDRVLFELRNEPHDMTADAWRMQANRLIETVRGIAPNHTLIVGFHDWNGRDAMLRSEPFADPNIIYTFHFYDPFIFTHQGAGWAGAGLPDLKNVPFPANPATRITVPASAKGTWIERAIANYANEATYNVVFQRIQAAKTWSDAKGVPIFLGEFGSYNLNADPDSRCRHAESIYVALGRFNIPSAWWEWDAGFSMFQKGTTTMMPCMSDAVATYTTGQLRVLATEPPGSEAIQVYPNPAQDALRIVSTGQAIALIRLTDAGGKTVLTGPLQTEISVATLPAGTYLLTVYDRTGAVLSTKRVIKP